MNKLDFNNLNLNVSSAYNSARQISEQFNAQYAAIDQMNREKACHDAKMVAGAEASIAKKEWKERQLLSRSRRFLLAGDFYERTNKTAN